MIAVVVVRGGVLPAGADETVAEAGGRALLCGSGTEASAAELTAATEVGCAELGSFSPGAWARALADELARDEVIVLPASPDGRDLAPRIAHVLGRPLLAGAIAVDERRAVLNRRGGLVTEEHAITGPVVATFEPGVRGVEPSEKPPTVTRVALALVGGCDAVVIEVLPPDPATIDLAEASMIIAGGAGLGGGEAFTVLQKVATALGASYGASRVAADAGWAPQDRFIGTTGVAVDPDLYVALGISGAVQHVSGLGQPSHVVAVNTDVSAPMMAMADLAIVADARAVLDALAERLAAERG